MRRRYALKPFFRAWRDPIVWRVGIEGYFDTPSPVYVYYTVGVGVALVCWQIEFGLCFRRKEARG